MSSTQSNRRPSLIKMVLRCPDIDCKIPRGASEKDHNEKCMEDPRFIYEEAIFREHHLGNNKLGDQVIFIEKDAYDRLYEASLKIILLNPDYLDLSGAKQILEEAINGNT